MQLVREYVNVMNCGKRDVMWLRHSEEFSQQFY